MDSVLEKVSANAANEGIPVAAIARIVQTPLDEVYALLKDQKSRGVIAELPRADWPPGTRTSDRLPALSLPNDDDLAFLCTKTFKLTGLEAGFLVVLLKHGQVEKSRLHNIVEQKRATRQSQPSSQEATDPKMVDVMICKLRKKLKAVDKDLKIETIWGGGYYIETPMKPLILAHVNGAPPHAQQEAPSALDLGAAARAAGPSTY
jgi:hypothetical protein